MGYNGLLGRCYVDGHCGQHLEYLPSDAIKHRTSLDSNKPDRSGCIRSSPSAPLSLVYYPKAIGLDHRLLLLVVVHYIELRQLWCLFGKYHVCKVVARGWAYNTNITK